MDVAFNPSVDVVKLRTDEEGTKRGCRIILAKYYRTVAGCSTN